MLKRKPGRPSAQARGYDQAWARLRIRHLRLHPNCAVKGCGKPGKHVDHIESVRIAPHRRLDPSNLETLCHAHHNRLTAAYDCGSVRGACDHDGMPLDPQHPWAQADNRAALAAAVAKPAVSASVAVRLKLAAVHGRTH